MSSNTWSLVRLIDAIIKEKHNVNNDTRLNTASSSFVYKIKEIITEEHKRMSAEIENLLETETDGVKNKHTLTCRVDWG